MAAQNGWPIVTNDAAGRAKLAFVSGLAEPNNVRVLAGDVATVFNWLVREYAARVEPITPAWCWGWNVRKIEGSDDWSNHAAACAIDINAPDNPMGSGTTARSMTPAQIAVCHELERESGGVLRWGGDFGRNDPMHWEIHGTPAEVAVFAEKIRAEEDDMPTAEEIAKAVWQEYKLSNGSSPGGQLITLGQRTDATTNRQLPAVLAKLDVDQVDEPAIVAGVLAGLDPAAIAAAIPADLAQRVADELHARLAS